MSEQYLRKIALQVGDNEGDYYDLSQLHVQFQIRNANIQTLKWAVIRIYNPSNALAQTIQRQYVRVTLSAGYEDNLASIFQGEIYAIERGQENATDTYLEIRAQDGDRAYNLAVSTIILPIHYLADDIYKHILGDLGRYGITQGYKPPFKETPSMGAYSFHGRTRDALRQLAKDVDCTWGIEDGKLNFTPINGIIPGPVPVLTAASGLIGTPRQTIGGINLRCLLNPAIRAGGQISIDNASLATLRLTEYNRTPDYVPSTDNDGAYKAFQVTQTGDTRGNAWYTDCICSAVDGTVPLTHTYVEAVPDNG
jgi:hypothetical protein